MPIYGLADKVLGKTVPGTEPNLVYTNQLTAEILGKN